MKFTDGYWLVREGFNIHSPKTVYDVHEKTNGVTIFAPCQYINDRGDTLNIAQLTIEISSPAENIIRVQTWHHKGGKPKYPNFAVNETSPHLQVTQTDEQVTIQSGSMRVVISKEIFKMDFYDGEHKLTHCDTKGLAWIEGPNKDAYMRAQLNLGVGEQLYGLGERFTPFVKNGQSVEMWNRDGGTSSEQAYKNVPFFLSNKGYGVFVNHPENVEFELGSETVAKSQFSVPGEMIDYYIMSGETPKEVITRYTNLTGKPALPPAWSFGLWLTTSFSTEYNEETVNHFVDGMFERNIPLKVFHFDCFWMKGFEWCNFEWDRNNFPDPEGMIQRLKAKGLKICVWINPYIAQKSKLFDEAVEKGYLIKKANGDVWQWDLWQSGMGIVDFTNEDACEWYANLLRDLVDMGVDSFKTDFGERIPTDVVYADGSDPYRMHNYYSYKYNEIVFNVLKEKLGEHEAAVFARSATTGGQKFPVHWGGDCDSTYESMAESLRGGLSLTASGFGYWSHDIGGFENIATPDLFKRWLAFGLLSTHSRLHGSISYRVPWAYDEEAVDVASHFTRLKNRLMPYLYDSAYKNHVTGIPMMRAMLFDFPQDLTCSMLDRQYMLGDSLLVAPIFSETGEVTYYLPEGKWTHLFTGEVVKGGSWRTETYDYMNLPLFVKENTILPIGFNEHETEYEYAKDICFHLYEIADEQTISTTIRNTKGELAGTIAVTRNGDTLVIQTDVEQYSICVSGRQSVTATTSGEVETSAVGVVVKPEQGVQEFKITL
ncbi:alpha-xylosidase [Bacillus massiliigorillae]|uniref:alpha-xylosidase n=1 Tax=Bacillus massiliigorillae TaxID=1243664 RepID=UPI00039B63CC|nr:alpha-xylosidase [Bacillus massiliigorillae]